jgi:hydrogenase maturation factor
MNQIIHQQQVLEPITPLGAYCEPDAHGRCITCSDEALPATVLAIDELGWTAVVQIEDQTTEIDISLVDDVSVGTILLAHGGVALEKMEVGNQ